MAAAVGKYAAQKMLKKQMKDYKAKNVDSGQDPYFALIEDPKRPGKMKKVKKQIPAYIPQHDALILARVRKSAYRLDMCLFNLFGIRFGWEAVIGLIPVAGDVIGVAMALLLFKKCCQVDGGLDNSVRVRMLINIVLDFVVGLVPFVGDLADAAFKCNTKNLRLLEVTLDKKYRPQGAQRRDERDWVGVDREKRRANRRSGIYHPQDPPPATVFEEFSDSEDERRQYGQSEQGAAVGGVRQPQVARAPEERRGGERDAKQSRGGWFSGATLGGKVQRPEGGRSPRGQETGTVRV